jgi:DNA polymerase III subunit beta
VKIRLNRTEVADAAAWVSQAISRNPASPQLAGMLLDAEEGSVLLTGFDMDTVHEAQVSADVLEEGPALVSGRFLTSIIAAMKGDVVELETDAQTLTVSAGRSRYRMQTMNPSDYPALPKFPTHVGSVAADALAHVLATTEHALCRDPKYLNMTPFHIVGSAGVLNLYTTDRFRIARATTNWADASGSDFAANAPGLPLLAAAKGLSGDVAIGSDGADGGLFGLADASRTVVTRVLGNEHKFPKVEQVLSKPSPIHVQADAPLLMEALKRAMLVSDDRALVLVEFSDSLIRVTAEGGISDGSEEIDCEPGFGEGDMTLRFNAAYLIAALDASPTARVRLGITGPGKAMTVEPVGSDAAEFVVMTRFEL